MQIKAQNSYTGLDFFLCLKPPNKILGFKQNTDSNYTIIDHDSSSIDIGWSPFDGPEWTCLVGELDLMFLYANSVGMYARHVRDRMSSRSSTRFSCSDWWEAGSGPFGVAIVGTWFGKSSFKFRYLFPFVLSFFLYIRIPRGEKFLFVSSLCESNTGFHLKTN